MDFEIIERYGYKFVQEDWDALEVVGKDIHVIIKSERIGYQFTQSGDGTRHVNRQIYEDPRTGERFTMWGGIFLPVEEVIYKDEGLGFYRAVGQTGEVKIKGEWVIGLPKAQEIFKFISDIRGEAKYSVVGFNDGRRFGTMSGMYADQAVEYLREQRKNGLEAHIYTEEDVPEDFDTCAWDRSEWDVVFNTGGVE